MKIIRQNYPLIVLGRKISDEDWRNYKLDKQEVGELKKKKYSVAEWTEPFGELDFPGRDWKVGQQVCKHFGCGRTLTLREALFGNFCIHHNKTEYRNEQLFRKKTI